MNHPAIQHVCVIGIPHPEDGDLPMAVIVPSAGYKATLDEEEIQNFVAESAPDRMKLRGGVKFIDSLPTTPSGKIKRRELRDMILKGDM